MRGLLARFSKHGMMTGLAPAGIATAITIVPLDQRPGPFAVQPGLPQICQRTRCVQPPDGLALKQTVAQVHLLIEESSVTARDLNARAADLIALQQVFRPNNGCNPQGFPHQAGIA